MAIGQCRNANGLCSGPGSNIFGRADLIVRCCADQAIRRINKTAGGTAARQIAVAAIDPGHRAFGAAPLSSGYHVVAIAGEFDEAIVC